MSHAPQQQPIHHKDGYHYYVKQYIENHMNEIVDVVGFRGGWERWLQIELARTINAEWHQPVLCEQRIWNNGQIDLWAKAARPEDKVPFVGIELKCRTALEEGNQFANRFHEDLKKIAKRPNDENTPCFLYATALGYKVDTETLYLNVRDPNNNQPIPIYYEEVMPGAFLIYTWVEHKGTKPSGVVRRCLSTYKGMEGGESAAESSAKASETCPSHFNGLDIFHSTSISHLPSKHICATVSSHSPMTRRQAPDILTSAQATELTIEADNNQNTAAGAPKKKARITTEQKGMDREERTGLSWVTDEHRRLSEYLANPTPGALTQVELARDLIQSLIKGNARRQLEITEGLRDTPSLNHWQLKSWQDYYQLIRRVLLTSTALWLSKERIQPSTLSISRVPGSGVFWMLTRIITEDSKMIFGATLADYLGYDKTNSYWYAIDLAFMVIQKRVLRKCLVNSNNEVEIKAKFC